MSDPFFATVAATGERLSMRKSQGGICAGNLRKYSFCAHFARDNGFAMFEKDGRDGGKTLVATLLLIFSELLH